MTAEDNSHLISRLYATSDSEDIKEILEDIEEIGDPIFLEPIFDSYVKNIGSHFDHYFLSALGHIKSNRMTDYLDRALELTMGKRPDLLPWVFNAMTHHEYFPSRANELAKSYLGYFKDKQSRKELLLISVNLEFILEFLRKANTIGEVRSSLRELFFGKTLNRDERSIVLGYLLRIDPGQEFEWLIQNYEAIGKDTELETIVAKQLLGWHKGKADVLKNLIIEKSYGRAREILEKEKADLEAKQAHEDRIVQQEERIVFSNAKTIKEIAEIRRRLNLKTLSHEKFQFKLFPDNDLLIQQIETAVDESSLNQACVELRSIIQDLNKTIERHELDEQAIAALLPSVSKQDQKRSLNQFYLFLNSKGFGADLSLFGLRAVNHILTLLAAHPENQSAFVQTMKKYGLLEMYQNQEWSKLHNHLLVSYKTALEKLDAFLS